MTARTKIDIYVGTLSIEFGNTFIDLVNLEGVETVSYRHQIAGSDSTNNLSREQEEKVMNVLRKHKKAISWTLANLPWINPSIFMHKILLKEDA
ncbi:hypothetical protein CR513_36253, partial [Mucuna pruriens]